MPDPAFGSESQDPRQTGSAAAGNTHKSSGWGSGQGSGRIRRIGLSIILIAIVAVSWSGLLEEHAGTSAQAIFQRALVTAAIARGLNGIISVAQGTEIAIQPVGIGVTITAGQILDPLNDLVERFSWLALAASASLGTQLLLTEVFAEPLVNLALTVTVFVYLIAIWSTRKPPLLGWLLRVAALVIFMRFLFTLVTLTVGWVDQWVLEERQQLAMNQLTQASAEIEALRQNTQVDPSDPSTEASILERFESVLDVTRQVLDIQDQLSTLQVKVESSISQLIDLMVLFLVQTLILPLAALWLAIAFFRQFWGWTARLPEISPNST